MDNTERAQQLYKDKKVLILGLGINQGGLGATKFFVKAGAKVRVTDLKSAAELKSSLDELQEFPEIEYTLREHKYEDIDWADLIIKNPALKPGNQYVEYAKEKGKQIEMDMGIFLQFVSPKQVIGVTGTKGKSTTAAMIYEILKNCLPINTQSHPELVSGSTSNNSFGHDQIPKQVRNDDNNSDNIIFAGNIGKSVLDAISLIHENSLVVLELSSFQLEAWEQHHLSPHWAVITNIFPDHLNYYGSMEEYVKSKRWIAENQNTDDFLFLGKNDPETTKPAFLLGLSGQITYFSSTDLPADFHPNLPGEHNLINMAAALAVVRTLGIPNEQAVEVLKSFKGVELRMELVKVWNNIKFYNDTTATNPRSATLALKSLPNAILIAGGQNALLPYDEFAKEIDQMAQSVYFLEGDATEEIKNLMQQKEKIKGEYNNFQELFSDLKPTLQSGDIVLFSPGAKSFNLFQNEFDRGKKFNEQLKYVFPDFQSP